jgi:two-component system sensor histidine kinase/response regulator
LQAERALGGPSRLEVASRWNSEPLEQRDEKHERVAMMNKPYVLIVDDEESILVTTRLILEAEGYAVLTASDGAQALQVMEQTTPDLIVADIMMPRMDGYALYKAVRARPDWVFIAFIFITGKIGLQDVLKGKALGVEDYIPKPFDAEELIVAVRARLARAREVRDAFEAHLDQLKWQIVKILGHELRTPLTLIHGYNELAMQEAPPLAPAPPQQFLLGIKKGADRLAQVLQDFLLLLCLDTGQVQEAFEAQAFVHRDLQEEVEYALQAYREQSQAGGISLESRTEPDLPPVRLHGFYFADALGRLVDNAFKFSQGKGQRVEIVTRAVDGGVEVSVSDEGVGIPPQALSYLFERFRQVDRKQMEQQGVGLGLAIARELIRLHGGDITVESVHGQGSTFTIHLPAIVEERSEPDP